MAEERNMVCPQCGQDFQPGFAGRSIGLSFIAPEKFAKNVFIDEDLVRSGLRKLLPAKAEYYRSYLCRSCQLYLIDYSKGLSRPLTLLGNSWIVAPLAMVPIASNEVVPKRYGQQRWSCSHGRHLGGGKDQQRTRLLGDFWIFMAKLWSKIPK